MKVMVNETSGKLSLGTDSRERSYKAKDNKLMSLTTDWPSNTYTSLLPYISKATLRCSSHKAAQRLVQWRQLVFSYCIGSTKPVTEFIVLTK